MPKYLVGGSFGFAGTDWKEVLEFDSLKEAEEYAEEYALERIEWWAQELDAEKDDAKED